jgi:hypothetical protein
MYLRRLTVCVLAAALLFPTLTFAETPASFRFTWHNDRETNGSAIVRDGVVYIAAEEVFIVAGLQMEWDSAHQRFRLISDKLKMALRLGSKTGYVNGKVTDIGGVPFVSNKRTYIPARFIVNALSGNNLKWNKSDRILQATGLHDAMTENRTYGGLIYSIELETSDLYVTDSKGNKRKLTDLGSHDFDSSEFHFQPTDGGLLIVTIHDNYGEPHVHDRMFTVLIKDGGVIRQSTVNYFNRFTPNVVQYDNHPLLIDEKKLRIVEDGTGAVLETIDLVKLGAEDDAYFIEGIDDDFLLFRANHKGILTLYNRKTGETLQLYKQLLDEKDQQIAETNDFPYLGDFLEFIDRQGQTLRFRNHSMLDTNGIDTIYEYVLPSSKSHK